MNQELLSQHIEAHREALQHLLQHTGADWAAASELMVQTLRAGRKILVCGNGGSAADAQHFACEIVGRFLAKHRRALPVIALTTDPSVITAVANDFGYEEVFARQVEAHGTEGDLFLGITTSGRSPNVLAAMRAARERGMRCIALLGKNPSDAGALAEVSVCVPAMETPRIQEMHILLIHSWCDAIDRAFPEAAS